MALHEYILKKAMQQNIFCIFRHKLAHKILNNQSIIYFVFLKVLY